MSAKPQIDRYSAHLKKDRWLRREGWEVWRFTSAEVIRVGITTDGTGALTNGILTITVRPLLGGEY